LFTQGLHLNIKIYKILIFVFIKYKKGFIMVGALWTGISGLHGQQRALDNESNNIANVNTVGYKSSRISFEDQMYQENIGKGVSSFEVEKLYSQGNLKVTGVSYDMALSGDGFFQLSNGTDYFYSRAGNFRMGENGELQNVGGLMVQGWAMSPLQPDSDVSSTDENVNKFTSDYSKLLGNQILRNSNDVTTKVAKATDYTETAATDSTTIFAGAGQKSAATKIADIEALITEYNTQLTLYANTEPKPASTESSKQRSLIDFDLDNAKLASGDEMYIYIDGTKYSERFDTDEQTTFKNLVDKISNVTGLNAYVTDGADPYDMDTQSKLGKFMIDGIVPGKSFTVSEFGWTDSSNSNAATKGTVEEIQQFLCQLKYHILSP
jgi:flagellar hook protein FlgE